MNLKTLLFDAFASRPHPSSDLIIQPDASIHETDRLRELLATTTSTELTEYELRTVVEGNFSKLTPEALRYFLPALLHASLDSYESLSILASELIDALIEPSRADVVETFDELAQIPPEAGLPKDMIELLGKQQLEWFDSGDPTATFHARFDTLTHTEGAAVLAFLDAFQQAYGEDFPFDELQTAIDRHWVRYRNS